MSLNTNIDESRQETIRRANGVKAWQDWCKKEAPRERELRRANPTLAYQGQKGNVYVTAEALKQFKALPPRNVVQQLADRPDHLEVPIPPTQEQV